MSVSGTEVARWEANDGLVLIAYAGEKQRWITVPGVATYVFDGSGTATATSASGADEDLVYDVWTRSVLPLVVQSRGTQVMHASAVRRPDDSVAAFCGRTSAGKSTLGAALMSLCHVEMVADDALGFQVEESRVTAIPLPFRLRLRPRSAAALGMPTVALERNGAKTSPLAVVVLLTPVSSGPPHFSRIRGAEAVGALMPHAYCWNLSDRKGALVSDYADLCGIVPVFRCTYQQSINKLGELVQAVETFLAQNQH
jgi:hypothetical protein